MSSSGWLVLVLRTLGEVAAGKFLAPGTKDLTLDKKLGHLRRISSCCEGCEGVPRICWDLARQSTKGPRHQPIRPSGNARWVSTAISMEDGAGTIGAPVVPLEPSQLT
jgi:hypothetical protein